MRLNLRPAMTLRGPVWNSPSMARTASLRGQPSLHPGPLNSYSIIAPGDMRPSISRNFLEGKTISDLIEYNGEEPSTKHAPFWSQELGAYELVQSGKQHRWEGELEEGDYFLVCVSITPFGAWTGTGLSVRE